MLLSLAVRAKRAGHRRIGSFLLFIDCVLAGLGGAAREIGTTIRRQTKI